ncbi:MAG: MG2 domain-containing protein, partial [Bryobacteraceae bacterium]
MRLARLLAVTLLLSAVLPVPAQEDEANVYFSLASNQTFSASEKPQVQLWTQGVQTLQFRLYRVSNATRFFQNLQDPHTMGEPPRRATSTAKKTPLEQFHAMKRAWRTRLRNVVRAQYTAENRATIRTGSNTPSGQTGPAVDHYAEVPVLNPQQLVSTWQVNVSTAHRWENQLVPVTTPGNGVYVVEATNGKLRAFTILQVSDLVVIVKGAPGRLVTQVVNRTTGDPVADAALVVWSGKKDLGRGTTDIDGMASFSFTEGQLEHVLVMAKKAEDFVANAVYGYSLNANNGSQWMGYVYTDRPVYRPGHQVHFRAIIRSMLGSGYRMPAVSDVDIEVQDNESKPVYRTKAKISTFGSVSGDFDLPATASLGYYSVQVKNGQSMAAGGFEVQEYKKPEYEVRVNPDKPRVLQGEPIKATIVARYYFGEPVANAKVTWVVHKARYWNPLYAEEEYGEEGDGEGGEEGGYYAGEQVAQDTGQTDADGKLAITFPNGVEKDDLIYRVEARVTDAANREIAGSTAVVATVGTFLINVQPDQYVYTPGAPASLHIETRDYDGNAAQADFTVSIHEWRWQGGPGRDVASGTGHTDAQGKARFDFKAPPGGSYQAKVTAVTPERREISDSTYLWISGGGDFWSSGGNQRLQIVPDKKSYAAGEKAKVLLVTGQPKATLLVSIEGRDLYSTRVIRADSPTVTIDIPIDATQEPNFFVSASFIKDGKQFQGMKSINVPPVDHKINVDLKASKPVYKPGEAATYTIDARDNTGKPAAAEFSLGVVDEAIYAIRREMAPEILNFFYGRGWNRVNTSNSLTYYFQGQAGKRALQLARVKRHTLAQFKPEKLVDAKIRKAFPDTSFWNASLRTNAAGHAEAKFEFPDALTTWRATARGITADSRVGSAVSRVIIRKNLILRLSTPRFFRDGDEVTISALVHNYLASEKTARVSLTAQGADIIDGGTKDVSIPSKGEAHVDYRLRAKPGATVVLLGKALTDEESDALEITLPVIPFGVKLSEARSGSIFEATGSGGATLSFPAQSAPTSRTLVIEATPSMAGAIFGALEYLTGFPYGCVEQTMSSFLPNVIVSKAAKDLKLKSNLNEAELGKKIRAGLDRLYDFQHEDGG